MNLFVLKVTSDNGTRPPYKKILRRWNKEEKVRLHSSQINEWIWSFWLTVVAFIILGIIIRVTALFTRIPLRSTIRHFQFLTSARLTCTNKFKLHLLLSRNHAQTNGITLHGLTAEKSALRIDFDCYVKPK